MDRLARIKLIGYSSHWNTWGEDVISPGASESNLASERNKNSRSNIFQLLKTSQPGFVGVVPVAGRTPCFWENPALPMPLLPAKSGQQNCTVSELCRFSSQLSLMGAFSPLSSPSSAQPMEPVMLWHRTSKANTLPNVKILSKNKHRLILPSALWSKLPQGGW